MNCHICGKSAETTCIRCDEPACEDCLVPFSQFNQCTEDRCTECEDFYQKEKAEYFQLQEQAAKERDEKRKARNAAARRRYHLPEQVEKRRKARDELNRKREKMVSNAMIRIAKMFSRFF